MNKTKNIVVICEGSSEWIYIQRLNSFLMSLPFPDGWWNVPINFIGIPKKYGVGTGNYNNIEKEYRCAARTYPKEEKLVWVDSDLYIRNDKGCADNYLSRPNGIPPFCFSICNFEDFVALHLDDNRFNCWFNIMTNAGHFKNPLHWEEYKNYFKKVVPDYIKGSLPADFVTKESLGNLHRHLLQMPSVDSCGFKIERTFARVMIEEISNWYNISC